MVGTKYRNQASISQNMDILTDRPTNWLANSHIIGPTNRLANSHIIGSSINDQPIMCALKKYKYVHYPMHDWFEIRNVGTKEASVRKNLERTEELCTDCESIN